MIIARTEKGLQAITQSDHAHFAKELLALWRTDDLPDHPRRTSLLFAAREHDNGWWEADAAPRINAEDGRPHDFLSIPCAMRQDIWKLGVKRYREQDPYAALLILEHALNLHRSRRDDPAWQPLLSQWEEERRTGVEALEAEVTLAADYPWVDLTDLISLAVCNRWQQSFERYGVRGMVTDDTVSLTPFPLAGATTFRIATRTIPDRAYESDTDLTLTLASTPYTPVDVRVVRADDAMGVE